SAPDSTLETLKLCALKLDLLHSLFAVSKETQGVELEHTLRLENGSEILRVRTVWMPKNRKNFEQLNSKDT
ncbi:hypothetical protein TorRG33x02_289500, partial [Trema orientale]